MIFFVNICLVCIYEMTEIIFGGWTYTVFVLTNKNHCYMSKLNYSRITWAENPVFIRPISLKCSQLIMEILIGTNCAPLKADVFKYCNEREFMFHQGTTTTVKFYFLSKQKHLLDTGANSERRITNVGIFLSIAVIRPSVNYELRFDTAVTGFSQLPTSFICLGYYPTYFHGSYFGV